MAKKTKPFDPDAPFKYDDHPRPVTRRDFIRQGFLTGTAMTIGGNILNLMISDEAKAIDADVAALVDQSLCNTSLAGNARIPFIAFDLAGGANIAGSNVVVGGQAGQLDPLDAGGYARQGLRADEVPDVTNTNTTLGLRFHNSSALFAGISEKASAAAMALVNGTVIAARSDNDTGNNPHNPMYGIAKANVTGGVPGAGAKGGLVSLIGSRASDSGGNSMAPANLIDPNIRPTKIDRPSDVLNMVDTGELVGILSESDATNVMESVARISNMRINGLDPRLGDADANDAIRGILNCGYVKAAAVAEQFGTTDRIDVLKDPDILPVVGPTPVVPATGTTPIFTTDEFNGTGASSGRDGSEFRKTASVMKLVLDGSRDATGIITTGPNAGAGTITMGGYDYHTGNRTAGEDRDLRAGRCIGACIEYAHRRQIPVMIYLFSDGSVFSNGMEDPNNGRLVWTGDNSGTAASVILVYDPTGRPAVINNNEQIGYYRANGSVETSSTPGANNVNILVDMVCLNYMALHGQQGQFPIAFPNSGLGANLDAYTAFAPIVTDTFDNPV